MDYHRRSIRLDGYDYKKEGLYFVTIDVENKLKMFWDEIGINDAGKMIEKLICEMPIFYEGIYIVEYIVMPDHIHLIIEINNNGRIWESANDNNNGRKWDSSRTPQNIVGADPCICPKNNDCNNGRIWESANDNNNGRKWDSANDNNNGRKWDSARTPQNIVGADPRICPENIKKYSLSEIIQRFKIMSTNKYIFGVKNFGWSKFYGKLWQRNFYERIVRNDRELFNIKEYIRGNPEKAGLIRG